MYRKISLSWALLAAAFMLLTTHVLTAEATRISISPSRGPQMDGDHSIKKQLPQRNEEHVTPSTMPSIVYEWDTNEERFVMVDIVDTDMKYESKTQSKYVIHETSLPTVHDLQEKRSENDQGLHGTFKRLQALFQK